MNKVFRIVQYIQPWEIDDFERQVNEIIYATYDLPENIELIWDVTLNTSIVDWTKSSISEDYFIQKFNYLEKILSFYIKTEFDTDIIIQGCCDKRRICQNKKQDFTMWLDSDLFFTPNTLNALVNYALTLSDSYEKFILTPEIVKFWDDSWDVITNKHYINESHTYRQTFDCYSLTNTIIKENQEYNLKINKVPKFAGGWFNLFTNSVFELIPLREEIGAYGPDDTYTMYCSHILEIPQFVIEGCIVSEIGGKYKREYLKNSLEITTTDRKRISDQQLLDLTKEFYEKNKFYNTITQ